ncbi:hypothetical protein PFISCL1PPCAC_1791, partial [Pristionchus fissidentatus]
GIPLVAVPVAYDQLRNGQQVKRNGHGILVDKTELITAEPLRNAVIEMLNNGKYRERALQIKKMTEERPFEMKEIFVRHMEFLAVHGPLRQLDHYGRHLNFFQYYPIDVIAAVISVILLVVAIAVFI